VAANVSRQMGLSETKIITGPDLGQLSDYALVQRVLGVDVFAEIEPNQKERIILALRKAGNVVGYLGDGINDASALHAADVGISVESAVDVAKEAADIVLLEKDLGVLVQGVREGRATFANTLKYVFMATSANFGNMLMTFGLMSSVFDYLTFWCASAGFSCNSGSIPNRMVLGIGLFSVTNSLGHTKPETLLQEQTVEISVCGDSLNGCPDADFALHSTWHDFWV